MNESTVDEIVMAFNNTHAVLLNGPAAIGKSHLAAQVCLKLFKKYSLVQTENLFSAGTHPDLHVLTSAYSYHLLDSQLQNAALRYLDTEALEKKRLSRQIGVESIRSLTATMSESAALGGLKLVVISAAENMNQNAANALLKFLEEPTDETLIILISHDISKLAATIRSRCMKIYLIEPAQAQSLKWLKQIHTDKSETEIIMALNLASNRPLLASQYLTNNQQATVDGLIMDIERIVSNNVADIVVIARNWVKLKQTDFIVYWLGCFFRDLIKFKSSRTSFKSSHYHDQMDNIAKRLSISSLFDLYDYSVGMNQHYDGVLDESLLLEDVLITLSAATK